MALVMKKVLSPGLFFTLPVNESIGLVSDGLLADLVLEGSSSNREGGGSAPMRSAST